MIYLFTAIVFPPGGSGRQTGIEIGKMQLYTEGETVHKTIQRKESTKKKTKLKKNLNKILKHTSRVI